MTRNFVSFGVLFALLTGALAAQPLSPDCSQPTETGVRAAPADQLQPVFAPIETAQPEIQFPPSFNGGWLTSLFHIGAATPPVHPEWFPLDPKQQKSVDDLLADWEAANSQVDRFHCAFQRWEIEPIFGPRDGKMPRTYATGMLKYQAPNKAIWRTDELKNYVAPVKSGDKPDYVSSKHEFGEHWVCDGKRIFEFDYCRKTLVERSLPATLQGKPIGDGRFPFLYQRSAAAIKQRYWIRPLSPPTGIEDEYWLELWPRNQADAAAYKYVVAVIAQRDMRLAKVSIVARNFDAKKNAARVDFRFEKWSVALKGGTEWRFWNRDSFAPETPLGWEKVEKLPSPAPITDKH